MTKRLVEAVLFARYNSANFKALYGRLPGSTTYTKDYIQIPESVSGDLRRVLRAESERVDIQYVWPDGQQLGHLAWSVDRYHLKWETDNPPKPWRLGDTGNDPAASLPGDRSLRTEADADAQFSAITASETRPWLLAIKLANDPNRLHLRVYFENPAAGFEDRAVAHLPQRLRDGIAGLSAAVGSGIVDWSPGIASAPSSVIRAKKLVAQIVNALERDPNVLLIGPPGTGKSVALEDLQNIYAQNHAPGTPEFDPDSWPGEWSISNGFEGRSESLVFHPSYAYENFVAGLFPKSSHGGIELEAKAGPLLCVSHWVGETDRKALLILDEFNRGSAAAIFGDMLGLLDKEKRSGANRSGAHIQRPYPSQAMPVPTAYRRDPGVEEQISHEVRMPRGVYIVAAMNSTDRSVAPLDAAMRRRFTVIRVRPDYESLASHLALSEARLAQPLPLTGDPSQWTTEDISVLAINVLRALNERIEYCIGEDFLLGQALIWDLRGANPQEQLRDLSIAVDAKVLPTLRMTFIDQDDVLAAIMGVPDDVVVGAGQLPPNGRVAYWKGAPASLGAVAQQRLAIRLLQDMDAEQQLAALRALAEH